MKSLYFGLVFVSVMLLTIAAPVALAAPAADAPQWSGEYYNNLTLAGSPVLLRGDPEINFFWPEYTSPAPGLVNTSNYSIRWTREINFNATGNWTFTTVSDDGMRVWVDNQIASDWWCDQGPATHTGRLYLNAGSHVVKVEYYNRTLGGTARVNWAFEGATGEWRGEYYSNEDLSGAPAVTRNDADINFNWGTGSPDAKIPADHFSVRWTRSTYLDGGTWRFTTSADDGVRLWVDNTLLIDRWFDQSTNTTSADLSLGAGYHWLRIEYYDRHVSALAQMWYAPVNLASPSAGVWHAQYFDNASLSGSPVLVRDDPSLHFNWGTSSPGPSIPANYFSAKWDSVQVLPVSGNYSINVTSDDGIRVWIDGALVIDAWYDHSSAPLTATRYYAAGSHNVHVEYYDRTVNAMVGVDIVRSQQAVPIAATGQVMVDNQAAGWQAGGAASDWRETASGMGGRALWTYNTSNTASNYNWARWYPTLPSAGNYEVFAYIPGGVATTANARYWIYHAGQYDVAPRAQASSPNQWISLGTYRFSATGGEFVSLSDVSGECNLCTTLVFDAVKFSPR